MKKQKKVGLIMLMCLIVLLVQFNDHIFSAKVMDQNLKNALIEEGVDKNNNNQIGVFELKFYKSDMLMLDHHHIKDISGLEHLTGVSGLNLSGNQLSDISELSVLTQLNYLNLSKNMIDDVSDLKNLTDLETLRLSINNISDISPLLPLENLVELALSVNDLSELVNMSNFKSLKKLEVDDNHLISLADISKSVSITHLNISDNPIESVILLRQMDRLKSVTLRNMDIMDLDTFKDSNITIIQ